MILAAAAVGENHRHNGQATECVQAVDARWLLLRRRQLWRLRFSWWWRFNGALLQIGVRCGCAPGIVELAKCSPQAEYDYRGHLEPNNR